MRDYASLFSELLLDLALSPDEVGTHITSDMGAGLAARHAMASSFYKKLCPVGNSTVADAAALKKFSAINAALPEGPWDFEAVNEAESCFYDYFVNNLREALQPNSPEDCFGIGHLAEFMGVGPGAAQKADSRYMVTKLFESTLSCTNSDLLRYYRAALLQTGFWCDAEKQRTEEFGECIVEGGKIFFAPKNAEISRTCCTEASLNMLVQKAVGAFLEVRLVKCFGINLSTQPDLNRELARLGSIDGSYGTTDLTSASDSIGLSMFEAVCPNGTLRAFIRMSRSEHVILPNGTKLKARMVSTMGNGFTFPLQTLIFACCVKAVYDLMGIPFDRQGTKNFGVFGDDIIVVAKAFEFTNRMLTKLGFSVNTGKSFNTGPFRESCGHDYYSGVNIRGVYVRSLESPQQVYSCINRLLRWSSIHRVSVKCTVMLLRSWAREIRVPPSESDDAGVHVPFCMTRPQLDEKYWFKYRAYKRVVKKLKVNEPDTDDPPINENGVAVGYLSGHIRRRDSSILTADASAYWPVGQDCRANVSIRDRGGVRARYKIIHMTIPYWDYIPPILRKGSDFGKEDQEGCFGLTAESYSAWKSAVMDTLG